MTDWTTPLIVLLIGALAGAIAAWRGRSSRRRQDDSNLQELLAERDAVIAELRELSNEPSRYELELRAASLWRDLDQAEKKKIPATRTLSFRASAVHGFAWGIGMVAVVAGLLFFVQSTSTPRQASAASADQSGGSLMQLMNNDPAKAEEVLQQALLADPDRLDALVHLAVLYAETGRTSAALGAYQEAVRRHPEAAESLAPLAAEIRKLSGATDQVAIAGTIELRPGTKNAAGVVYVIARSIKGGPPVAVAKLTTDRFPLAFNLTANHSMTGGALPDKVRLEARVDSDGDAATKSPGDPSGVLDEIAVGRQDVRLVLQ